MTHRLRYTALTSAGLTALLLLSACGKSEAPAPANTPAAATSAAEPMPSNPPPVVPTMPATGSTAAAIAPTGSVATPAVAAAVALSVAKVTLGSDVNAQHQVAKAATTFASSDKTIYASVATTGRSGGATLNAKWTYLEGQSQLVSSISQSIATDGPAVTTFKVQNPDLWPEGKYQVEISLDGKPVAKQAFEVKKS